MTPEGRIASSIMQWLRSLPDTIAWKITDFNNVGFPDILICYKGLFATLEVKRKGGRLTAKQEYEGEKIMRAGGRHAKVESLDQVKQYLKKWFGVSAGGR